MKNVILISGLGLEGCMLCASIAQFIWEQNDVCVSFVPEEKVANLARKVDYFDLIILIDYNESILNNKKLNRLRGKLVLLKEIDEEIISKLNGEREELLRQARESVAKEEDDNTSLRNAGPDPDDEYAAFKKN